jgi:hypothetical protein
MYFNAKTFFLMPVKVKLFMMFDVQKIGYKIQVCSDHKVDSVL